MDKEIMIQNIYGEFTSKIHQLLEIKDSIGLSDCLELMDDSSKVFNFLRSSYNLISQKKFETFLKGFSPKEEPSEEQIRKLMNYVDNKEKAEFISNLFSKILLSKSIKSCIIMGYIMNDTINNKETIGHEQLILIDSLSNFIDYDINNFKLVCEYLEEIRPRKNFSYSVKFNKFIKDRNIDRKSMALSIDNAVLHQLIYKEIDINADVQNEDYSFNSVDSTEYFSLTSVGETLCKYIKQLNI